MDARILVVDDEPEIADLVEVYLKSKECTAFKCGTGTEALAVVRNRALGLAILDVMLPDTNSFTPCGGIHKERHFPMLILTTRAEGMDKTTGLTVDTDDYITKPLGPLELMARVETQLRRYARYNEADKTGDRRGIIDFNGLVINRTTCGCTLYDRELSLALIESDILWMLYKSRGQVISAERLFEGVWGEKYLDHNNTVMVHIRRLREKMGEPFRNPRFIKTVWGVGYKID